MAADRAHVVRAVAMSIGATLLVLELGARAITGSFGSFAPAAEVGGHSIVDRDVGYLLRDDVAVRVREGYEVHTRAHGIRSNGDQRPSRDRPITLVVGDSFAFGDEVLDSESWPAVLERAIDAPGSGASVVRRSFSSRSRRRRCRPIRGTRRIRATHVLTRSSHRS